MKPRGILRFEVQGEERRLKWRPWRGHRGKPERYGLSDIWERDIGKRSLPCQVSLLPIWCPIRHHWWGQFPLRVLEKTSLPGLSSDWRAKPSSSGWLCVLPFTRPFKQPIFIECLARARHSSCTFPVISPRSPPSHTKQAFLPTTLPKLLFSRSPRNPSLLNPVVKSLSSSHLTCQQHFTQWSVLFPSLSYLASSTTHSLGFSLS